MFHFDYVNAKLSPDGAVHNNTKVTIWHNSNSFVLTQYLTWCAMRRRMPLSPFYLPRRGALEMLVFLQNRTLFWILESFSSLRLLKALPLPYTLPVFVLVRDPTLPVMIMGDMFLDSTTNTFDNNLHSPTMLFGNTLWQIPLLRLLGAVGKSTFRTTK